MADPATAAASTPAADVVTELATAYRRLQDAEAEIEAIGEANVEAAADAYRNATRLLDNYEDSATGTGDFKAYLQFQNQFIALAEGLPEAALAADAVQRASDRMDKRRLNESDFEFAREQIAAAGEAVDLLERREDAHDAYRQARHDTKARREELAAEADRLRRVRDLGGVDLKTPLDPLREPVEAYNAAVREAFEAFRRTESARALLDVLEAAADRPLVDATRPPRDLADYIHTAPAGAEPLSTLQEYADYSPSKLDHYVDDPGALRTHVSVHQTYLDRLSPEPFLIAWPPAESGVLRARLRELAPLVRRLDAALDGEDAPGDGSDAIEYHRRRLARLTRTDDYDRLRQVAVAEDELSDAEFEMLAAGEVGEELAAVEDGLEAIDAALDSYAVE